MAKADMNAGASDCGHASRRLPGVVIDSNNLTIRDSEGYVGDQANGRAFLEILDEVRARMGEHGDDPLGDKATKDIGRERLGQILLEGDVEAAGAVMTAIEEFAQSLAAVIRRFLGETEWRGTERIAVGGGMRASRVGELALARAAALLRLDGLGLDLRPIDLDPDEAGLIGTAWLWRPEQIDGHAHLLAVDIGGSNIRAGILKLGDAGPQGPAGAEVLHMELWKHSDEEPSREETMDELAAMLERLIAKAEADGLDLAPLIGVGCPGEIRPDGAIVDGGHNLPGDWESPDFRLPERLKAALPEISGEETRILLHNDAVAQGLSQFPQMRDVTRWGVLTIGTGLGNARFSNLDGARRT